MLNPSAKLTDTLFSAPQQAATRDGFGKGLVEAAATDTRIVALSADLTESTRVEEFKKAYPERFIEVGVAEQNMATVAAGMANYGKIPFITSYAAFSPGRNWEQIRTTIALNDVPVKVVGMHAGVSVGPDGATHQMLEDIALMRAMPNMIVISPCDSEEGRKATLAAAQNGKPVYLRFGREKSPIITTPDTPFEIGKANLLWYSEHPVVALFATGILVHNALLAAKNLSEKGIEVSVINVHTIKPLDRESVIREASRAGAVVTIEEHQVSGGLGGAIAEACAAEHPVPIEFVAVPDVFGQSGTPAELIEHYGLGVSHIEAAVGKVITRK